MDYGLNNQKYLLRKIIFNEENASNSHTSFLQRNSVMFELFPLSGGFAGENLHDYSDRPTPSRVSGPW